MGREESIKTNILRQYKQSVASTTPPTPSTSHRPNPPRTLHPIAMMTVGHGRGKGRDTSTARWTKAAGTIIAVKEEEEEGGRG